MNPRPLAIAFALAVLAGSLVLGALYETGAVWALAAPLRPVVEGWLGLPAVAGLTLVFAVLRKELAADTPGCCPSGGAW